MLKKLLTTLVLFVITSILYSQQVKYNVYFPNDNYALSKNEKTKLQSFLNKIKKYNISSIQLSGHTDNNHSHQYNQILSKNRANTVSNYLKKLNVENFIISREFSGEEAPTTTNETQEGRAKNRRVEIIVNYSAQKNSLSKNEINAIKQKLVPQQNFTIDPNKKNTLRGNDGTVIIIPAGTFECINGTKLTKKVTINLQEYNSKADMILSGFHTQSNGNLLESGGMINIKAKSDECKTIKVKNGQSYNILFPVDDPKKDMQLFYGNHDKNGNLNWETNNANTFIQSISNPDSKKYPAIDKPDYEVFMQSFRRSSTRISGWQKFLNKFRSEENKRRSITSLLPNYNLSYLSLYNIKKGKKYSKPELDSIYKLQRKIWDEYEKKRLAHLARRKEEAKMFDSNEIHKMGKQNRNYYAIKSLRLGKINCDRFTRYSSTINQKISTTPNEDIQVSLVFASLRGMMMANFNKKSYFVPNVPKGKKAKVFVLKYEKNHALVGIKNIITTDVAIKNITYNKIPYTGLRKYLKNLFN